MGACSADSLLVCNPSLKETGLDLQALKSYSQRAAGVTHDSLTGF